MNLNAINIQAKPNERESLALALRAVARPAGADLNYDELCAALGISLVAVAGPPEDCPSLWLTYARDAFAISAARMFGMHLRDLHPPEVGVEMLQAEQFAQHFELSYKPLIRRALENGQPVIAWCGWEGNSASLWGVITAWDGQNFLGVTPGATGRVRLAEPSVQCYVVEQYERRTPSPDEVLAAAVAHANAYLSCPGSLFRSANLEAPQVVTGSVAYDRWAHWLQAQQPGGGDDPSRDAHRAYISSLCEARLSAMRFMQNSEAVRSPDHAAILDAIAAACDDLASDVCIFCHQEDALAFWNTAEGHQELLEAVRAAQIIDGQIAGYIHRLASAA